MTNSDLRGMCDVCHTSQRLTMDGFLMTHTFAGRTGADTCAGSGTPPAEAQPRLPGHQRGPLKHYAPPLEAPRPWPEKCTDCGSGAVRHHSINGRRIWTCSSCGAGMRILSAVQSQALRKHRNEQRKRERQARRKARAA